MLQVVLKYFNLNELSEGGCDELMLELVLCGYLLERFCHSTDHDVEIHQIVR